MLVIEVVGETAIRVIHYTGGVENRKEGGEASGFTSATSFSVLGIGRRGEGTGVVAEEVINVKPEDLKCLELLAGSCSCKRKQVHEQTATLHEACM